MGIDFEIYEGKDFSSLCKDVVPNSKKRRSQIEIIVSELRDLIKNVSDAVIIIPLIKEYLDIGVKNDEHLIKLAAVVQRLVNRNDNGEGNELLTEEEKEQLFKNIESAASSK